MALLGAAEHDKVSRLPQKWATPQSVTALFVASIYYADWLFFLNGIQKVRGSNSLGSTIRNACQVVPCLPSKQ